MDVDPETGDFEIVISSSLCTDTSAEKIHEDPFRSFFNVSCQQTDRQTNRQTNKQNTRRALHRLLVGGKKKMSSCVNKQKLMWLLFIDTD